MTSDDRSTTTRLGRRSYLAVGAAAVAGVAGCSRTDPRTGDEGTTESSGPQAVTREFYTTLYADNAIADANALYHPDSPVGGLEPADFEPYGGLEAMGTDIQSTELVSQDNGTARVHAEVVYTTARGRAESAVTDYMFLKKHQGAWRINRWAPEQLRRIRAKGTVENFYRTLYDDNDIEGANALYHPDSPASDLTAETFEPYGGLEGIETKIGSVEVVSEGGGEAEVHAEVAYTTPNGSQTMTDYVFLESVGGGWRIDRWRPEAVRSGNSSA